MPPASVLGISRDFLGKYKNLIKSLLLVVLVQIHFPVYSMTPSKFDSMLADVTRERDRFSDEKGGRFSASDLRKLTSEISRIHEVGFESGRRTVDLSWINEVVDEIELEKNFRRRENLIQNLFDTLEGLQKEISIDEGTREWSAQDIRDALKRASQKASPLEKKISMDLSMDAGSRKLSGEMFSESFEGEIIAVKTAETFGGSYSAGGSQGPYSGSGGGHRGSSSTGQSYGGNVPGTVTGGSNTGSSGVSGSFRSGSGSTSGAYSYPKETKQSSNPQRVNPPREQTFQPPPRQPPPPQPTPKPEPPKPPPPPPDAPNEGFLKTVFKILYWIMVILTVAAFLLILFFLYLAFRKGMAKEEKSLVLGTSALINEKEEPRSLYDEAIQAAKAGDFEKGIRLLTFAVFLLLDEKKITRFNLTCTNWEVFADIVRESSIKDLLAKPLKIFDGLIYGFRKPGRDDFNVFVKLYQELTERAGGKTP